MILEEPEIEDENWVWVTSNWVGETGMHQLVSALARHIKFS